MSEVRHLKLKACADDCPDLVIAGSRAYKFMCSRTYKSIDDLTQIPDWCLLPKAEKKNESH